MNSLLNKLSTLWLVLALMVAPLQALATLPAPADSSACPMHQYGHAGAGLHQQAHAHAGDHASTPCPQCSGHHCDDGKCGGPDCCSLQIQVSITAAPAVTLGGNRHPALYPDRSEKIDSLPASRLYRPPV